MRTQPFRSARARLLAVAATVASLVALGGVTAAPAAADVSAYVVVIDDSTGGFYGNQSITYGSVGGTMYTTMTDVSGGFNIPFGSDGNYVIGGLPATYAPVTPVYLDGSMTYAEIRIDNYIVEGSVPVDAANGATAVEVQYFNGATWVVASSSSVTTSTGDFGFRLPGGTGDYRLRLLPDPSTPYLETTTASFTIDGSVAVYVLGAVSLNLEPVVSGTVTDADTTLPIDGATVTLSANGSDVASDTTDASGAYSIYPGVGDEDYEVRVEASLYESQTGASAIPVNATDGYVHTGIDFALSAEQVTLTGTLLNAASFGEATTVELYEGNTGLPVLLDTTQTSRDGGTYGEYSFSGVSATGNYFLKFIPNGNDAFLPTLLGAGGVAEWADLPSTESDFSLNSSFTVDPAVPSSLVHDVTITQGSLVRGYLTSFGAPIDGCVLFDDINDPTISYCAAPASNGYWQIRLPAGGEYTMHATDGWGEYIDQWWAGADNSADATPIGPLTAGYFGDFNFDLEPSPASVYAFADDVSGDPITVHLYFLDGGGEWRDAGVGTTDPGASSNVVQFMDNYYTGNSDGLAGGDYRLRFQDSNGTWLAATDYTTGLLPDVSSGTQSGPACYIDLPGVAQGKPNFVDANFDAANQTEVCGPQPLNFGDVSGTVITSPTYGSVPVEGHYVDVYDDYRNYFGSTAADGSFTVDNVGNGDFTLEVYPGFHVWGQHEYSYTQSITLTGGNVDLGTLVATRYGNVSGTILNWDDATMAGATASVSYLVTDPDGDYWAPGKVQVDINSAGEFEVPGIDADNEYGLLITFPDTYSPVFIGGGYLEPDSPFTGTAEQDYSLGPVTVSLEELVTISGTVFFGTEPAAGSVVMAHPVGSCSCATFGAPVDLDGNYSIEVIPGLDYTVVALNPFTLMQVYQGYNYPFGYTGAIDSTPVPSGTAGATDINFTLVAADEVTFDLYTWSWDEPTDNYDDLSDVEVHLYQKAGDGWVEVDTDDSDPYADVIGDGDGDYRLRFELNGEWLAVHDVEVWSDYPYESTDYSYEDFDPAQCYLDFTDVRHGTYLEIDPSLVVDTSTTSCGPETELSYEVRGLVVQTANAGGGVIEGQTVTLTNQSTGTGYTATTDSSGEYVFENVVVGDYFVDFPSTQTTSGYFYQPLDTTLTVGGDEDLGDTELVRYGTAEVQILNFDATTMTGTTGQVYVDLSGSWVATGIEATVDSSGLLVVPGVVNDGMHTVYLDYPAGYVDGFIANFDGSVVTSYGYAEYDITSQETYAFTTISGLVSLGATAVSGADVSAESTWSDFYSTTSAVDGTYTLQVPAGYDFTVEATKSGLVRGIIPVVSVGNAPSTAVNLVMHYATFLFDIYEKTGPTSMVPTSTVTVHLYRQLTGGWQEVASGAASTVQLWTNLSGNYRLRFSEGSDWLAVSDYEWQDDHDSSDAGAHTAPAAAVCVVDFTPADAGAEYLGGMAVDPASSVECGAEPAVVAPPVTPGSTGTGKTRTTSTTTSTTEEVAPTATPTPTPSATASDEPDEQPSATPTAAPVATSSGIDLGWLFWLAGVILLLVLAGGVFWIVRRR